MVHCQFVTTRYITMTNGKNRALQIPHLSNAKSCSRLIRAAYSTYFSLGGAEWINAVVKGRQRATSVLAAAAR
jgi:hypothetical protein